MREVWHGRRHRETASCTATGQPGRSPLLWTLRAVRSLHRPGIDTKRATIKVTQSTEPSEGPAHSVGMGHRNAEPAPSPSSSAPTRPTTSRAWPRRRLALGLWPTPHDARNAGQDAPQRGHPRDFSGTFSSVPGTFQGPFAESVGKGPTVLKDAKSQVGAGFLLVDDARQGVSPRGLRWPGLTAWTGARRGCESHSAVAPPLALLQVNSP